MTTMLSNQTSAAVEHLLALHPTMSQAAAEYLVSNPFALAGYNALNEGIKATVAEDRRRGFGLEFAGP